MKIHPELAEKTIRMRVAASLGMTTIDAAHAIFEIVNANIVNAIKLVTVARGYDPKDFSLLAFGGAGPLHATKLARRIENSRSHYPLLTRYNFRLWPVVCGHQARLRPDADQSIGNH